MARIPAGGRTAALTRGRDPGEPADQGRGSLWTIWFTYVLFRIVVVIDLAFGYLISSPPGGRHGGDGGIVPHGSTVMNIGGRRACL